MLSGLSDLYESLKSLEDNISQNSALFVIKVYFCNSISMDMQYQNIVISLCSTYKFTYVSTGHKDGNRDLGFGDFPLTLKIAKVSHVYFWILVIFMKTIEHKY